MVVRVEYDRSNRVCIRRTGNRPSYAVAQGGQFFYRGAGPLCPPPTGAAARCVYVKLFLYCRKLNVSKINLLKDSKLSK